MRRGRISIYGTVKVTITTCRFINVPWRGTVPVIGVCYQIMCNNVWLIIKANITVSRSKKGGETKAYCNGNNM